MTGFDQKSPPRATRRSATPLTSRKDPTRCAGSTDVVADVDVDVDANVVVDVVVDGDGDVPA
jgi:hypothetical protein